MDIQDVKKSITPLRLIFWGGLICVLDFKFNGFDLLNDVIGTILISCGAFTLSQIRVNEKYRAAMIYVVAVSFISVLVSFFEHFIFRPDDIISFLIQVYNLASLIAIVLFCLAMKWFCIEAKLTISTRSWHVTTILFTVIYLIPMGLLYISSIFAIITGSSFHFNLGLAALFLIALFLVPPIHLFISTSRMKTEAHSKPPVDYMDEPAMQIE